MNTPSTTPPSRPTLFSNFLNWFIDSLKLTIAIFHTCIAHPVRCVAGVARACHLLRSQIIVVALAVFLLGYGQTVDEYRALLSPVRAEFSWLPYVALVASLVTLLVCFPFTIWFTSRWLTELNDDGSRPSGTEMKPDYRSAADAANAARLILPRLLAILPLLTVAVSAYQQGRQSDGTALYWAAAVCSLAIIVWLAIFITRTRNNLFKFVSNMLETDFRDLWLFFLVFLVLSLLSTWVSPVFMPQLLGTLTYGVGFFIVILVFTTFLTRAQMRTKVPFMVILGMWAGVLAYFDATNNHDVDTLVGGAPSETDTRQILLPEQVGLQTAFETWLTRKAERQSVSDPDGKIPVFIVAAAGGGIYAAQNAAFTLAKLDDSLAAEGCGAFSKHVFAVSGVSGGSVGAAIHGAVLKGQLAANTQDGGCRTPDGTLEETMFKILNEDLLSPVIANFVTLDYPQRFLPAYPVSFPDRAKALEDVVVSSVSKYDPKAVAFLEAPASALWSPESGLPALVLNVTELQTGRTVSSAPFKIRGHESDGDILSPFSQKDVTFREILAKRPNNTDVYKSMENCSENKLGEEALQTFKEDRDLSLVQAAVMSARFPYASPGGTLTRLVASAECAGTNDHGTMLFQAETQYIDGGYVEASGTEQALRLVKLLQDQIRQNCSAARNADAGNFWCRVDLHLVAVNLRTPDLLADSSYGLVLTPPIGLLKTWSRRSVTSLEVANDYFALNKKLKRQEKPLQGIGELIRVEPYDERKQIPLGWRLSSGTSMTLQELLCEGKAADALTRLLLIASPSTPANLSCVNKGTSKDT